MNIYRKLRAYDDGDPVHLLCEYTAADPDFVVHVHLCRSFDMPSILILNVHRTKFPTGYIDSMYRYLFSIVAFHRLCVVGQQPCRVLDSPLLCQSFDRGPHV